jgi:dTMP kinase
LEGGEGCGKSTQIPRLAERLHALDREVVLTREPGGTPLGEEIRHLLKFASSGHGMCPEAEFLLFSASRSQLVRELIRPALDRGAVVLADRFHDSSTAYQGWARGLPLDLVQQVHALALGGLRPHLSLILDMDAHAAHERMTRRAGAGNPAPDRMESEPVEFYQRVRDGYLAIAAAEADRVRIIRADQSPDQVAADIWTHVAPLVASAPAPVG